MNRFRSKVAREGLDMGPVIVGFIERYMEPEAVAQTFAAGPVARPAEPFEKTQIRRHRKITATASAQS